MGKHWIELSSIRPGASGGVEIVATQLSRAIIQLAPDTGIVVRASDKVGWLRELAIEPRAVREIGGLAGSNPVGLRSVVTAAPGGTRLRNFLAAQASRTRASRVAAALPNDIYWYPFHRDPIGPANSVMTCHDMRVFQPHLADVTSQRILKANLRRAAAVVVSWKHPYDDLLARFPEVRDRAFLIPLPVLSLGRIRATTNSPRGGPRILVPAGMSVHKNQELVIQAMAHMPQAQVVFTGPTDKRRAEYLHQLARRLGVLERITWLGYVEADQLESEYERCDLVVMPSRWEAASGPVFEAVARGIPFVATNIPPIRAQLEQFGLVGPLVSPDDPRELADAVAKVCSEYAFFAAAQRPVAERLAAWTWDETAERYLNVMEWVESKGEGGR